MKNVDSWNDLALATIQKKLISRLTEVNTIANLLEVNSEEVKQALLTRVIAAGGQVCNDFYFMQESFH